MKICNMTRRSTTIEYGVYAGTTCVKQEGSLASRTTLINSDAGLYRAEPASQRVGLGLNGKVDYATGGEI